MLRTSLIALATFAIAGCATDAATETADRDCFPARSVNGYEVIDDYHVMVTAGANRNYIMTTLFNARDLDWTQSLALRSQTGFICTGNGLGVELIGGNQLQQRYPIQSIERAPEPPPADGS
jgi:hypothetical protein